MKNLIATLLLCFCASMSWAQTVAGSATSISGARWTITNSTVQPSDLFYVGLQNVNANLLALDLVFNSLRFTRFSTYGDYGTRAGGSEVRSFSGYGYLFPNGSVHINLTDSLTLNWDCYLNSSLTGSCVVYTSASRRLGEVRLTWNPSF